MSTYLQMVSLVLVTVILCIILNRQGKDISVLLTILVICGVLGAVASYLRPVMDFATRLQTLGNLDSNVTGVLWKAVGIGLLGEISAMVCQDAGNSSLGKAIQVLTTVTVVWLSIPLMNALLDLIQKILGDV